MTRIYFTAGRVRLRMIAAEGVVLTLLGAANLAAYAWLLELPAPQLRAQGLSIALFVLAAFVLLASYSLVALQPVSLMLEELREEGISGHEQEAHRVALRFPLRITAVALLASLGTLALGLLFDVTWGGLELPFAAGLALVTASVLLAACTFIYLVARGLMRPIVAHYRHETVPPGPRVAIGPKVTLGLVSLCLAAAYPTAFIAAARLSNLERQYRQTRRARVAEALAHGARALSPQVLEQSIASLHLPRAGRVRLQRGTAGCPPRAAIPDGHCVVIHEEAPAPEQPIGLVVIGVLVLGGTFLVSRHLGQSLSGDVRLVAARAQALAAGTSELQPLAGGQPQFSDVRRLADALNDLLERIVAIQVSHFVAIEKTLEAERVKTQFLANVSHDLRSPLNAILGFSQLLLRDGESLTERQRDELSTILRCGNELLELINQVLDTAKVDSGRITLHREEVPATELLTRTVRAVQKGGVPAGIHIETELQPGMPAATVDSQRLVQAMAFVLRFCVESMDRGRIVAQLRAEQREASSGTEPQRALVFRVATTSGGLPEREAERLFVGFRRRPGARGLGLGLPLARAFIELHGGTLSVSSSMGLGMHFTVEIPLLQPKVLARLRARRKPEPAES